MSVITIEKRILEKNDEIAAQNRRLLQTNHTFTVNLLSSPGAGKTTLLEKTLLHLDPLHVAVIEGDVQTDRDAQRISAIGFQAVQIITQGGCHLDAALVRDALNSLLLPECRLLFIENVGNLVCPAAFDLGEDCKVVIASTTEGEDKPIKYPRVFREASLCLLNKIDLVSVLDFDRRAFYSHIQSVHADLKVIEISAKTGEGMNDWLSWIQQTAMQTNKTQPC
ncbi:MAG TPA: hydrogenase nickel incorporation protein HypB [bacterium]|nr:hydrogenase nickel incorporation protein HypB [bacterium]HNT65490.1 hydrogenase nickel incorporation protein HypB [bacterium]HOX87555.1 hydrogenase nickel incorporation protein HypB [bacterium]HPG47261.1 hydrogenase nickel incorporation protein HypB [bacterium]HPM99533.1 hydrogenase nickel incorporation protein HypB [bacterium]